MSIYVTLPKFCGIKLSAGVAGEKYWYKVYSDSHAPKTNKLSVYSVEKQDLGDMKSMKLDILLHCIS